MLTFSAVAETILRYGRNRGGGLPLAIAAGALVGLSGCDQGWFNPHTPVVQAAYSACPRPDGPQGRQPQFNQQQHEVRGLRELAFHGDFFAQLDLGDRYAAKRDADKNLDDPIEAAVWYALAVTNPQGYETMAPRPALYDQGYRGYGPPQPTSGSLYDDCRAFERIEASGSLGQLWSHMSSQEQEEVRRRIVYVLSTQGAPGFRVLARITQTDTGPYGEPREAPVLFPRHHGWWSDLYVPGFGPPPAPLAPPPRLYAIELFPRNDVDAYMYDYLAAQGGDMGAYVLLKDFEAGSPDRAGYADFVAAKANRWVPPYEFYPPDAPSSGVPHSDESSYVDEAGEGALARIDELPFVHVVDALRYLRVVNGPAFVFDGRAYAAPVAGPPGPRGPPIRERVVVERGWNVLQPQEVSAFQAMIGREQTGHLTPLEKVRAVQYAAANGSTHAQLVLAVMYSEGIGVHADYARAFHWFQEADRGGSPEAKFAIANYFSLGVSGVADQDKAQAVALRLDSAMAGYRPSVNRLQAVLAQVSRKSRY